jgi:hypothetical protein
MPEPSVAKSKAPKSAKPDRADDDVHLRLPPEYGPILDTMKARTGRARTVSAQVAIEKLAREMGLEFKPNWPELL